MDDNSYQLVFAYLSLKDKTRLERVSKQFKNLVYLGIHYFDVTNQFVPNISNEDNVVDINRFESLMKKCLNIKRLDCSEALLNEPVLDIIIEFCTSLQAIELCVNDVTEEAITRFGDQLGHRLEEIHFCNEDESSQENQQILLRLCLNLKTVMCRHIQSIAVIASPFLEKTYLTHYQLWSAEEVLAFGRFVERHECELKYLAIYSVFNVYEYIDDILEYVQRLQNLSFFKFYVTSDEISRLPTQTFDNLGRVCKKYTQKHLPTELVEKIV